MRQKVSPLPPLWGHRLPVTAPALSARRPFARAGLHCLGTFGVDMIAVFDIEQVERNKQTYFFISSPSVIMIINVLIIKSARRLLLQI